MNPWFEELIRRIGRLVMADPESHDATTRYVLLAEAAYQKGRADALETELRRVTSLHIPVERPATVVYNTIANPGDAHL